MSQAKIRRALVSVSDKSGLVPFARELAKLKVEIISTGGTLKLLREEGIPVKAVDEVTGFPEILDGRVKTLHPKIHGGLLFRRDKAAHKSEAKKHAIEPIDLVVVNLYPFEKVTKDPSVDLEVAIENIDIGGPSMLRSAAKNWEAVTVICDPSDYATVCEEMKEHRGGVTKETRFHLALKVFERTSVYDRTIADFLRQKKEGATAGSLPLKFYADYAKFRDLRYGENPHQRAALYTPANAPVPLHYHSPHGKELSFNNLLDIEATLNILAEFEDPAACVVKHSNPCGIAEGREMTQALRLAIDSDPLSAFGGIVAINRPGTLKDVQEAFNALKFFEVFVAPSFEDSALELLKTRKNLRIIETGVLEAPLYDPRFLPSGGLLLQDADLPVRVRNAKLKEGLNFVTRARLSESEIDDLVFAFKCVKVVKSNAIVLTQGRQTVGIGAGQMSRVDSVDIACRKAGAKAAGSFLASDAFFPMPDSIEVAHEHKIRAIIQPGGSIKDKEVIETCDRFGIAMAFTGERHFRH